MTTQISGSGVTTGSIDLTIPLAVVDGGTGVSTDPYRMVTMTVNNGGANPFNNTLSSIDFTGIPSWAKRITVMFNVVSKSGTSLIQVQLGATTIQTTGYSGGGGVLAAATLAAAAASTGMVIHAPQAVDTVSGVAVITNVSGNVWAMSFVGGGTNANFVFTAGSSVTLSATLDRIRITTANGTDTFDAGSINVMYEG